jgi:hypothetical protein
MNKSQAMLAVAHLPHDHCTLGCEHPQPFTGKDKKRYCGHCHFVDGITTEMVPCSPEICD